MKMKHTIVAAAAMTLLSTTASAVDWGGYFRAGPGQKTTTAGDSSRCFGANMEGGTYRLGNECHTYGEFMLSQGGQAGKVDRHVGIGFHHGQSPRALGSPSPFTWARQ